MVKLTDNLRGALLMMGSMTGFTINDAFMKSVAGDLHPFQAIFTRGLMVVPALILLCLALGQFRARLSRADRTRLAIRTLAEIVATYCFITALFNMPLANVSAILQALPLTVSLAAALVFRERLGWRRVTAILVGFAGVLLIVRPGGADFNAYSLLALMAVAAVTVRDLAARRLSRDVPSVLTALIAAAAVTLAAGLMSLTQERVALPASALWNLAGATGFIIVGYVCSVAAMRVGEIGVVAPFRYTSLLVALILGYLVFGEVPRAITFLGAGIVVATGLFTLYRETKAARRASLTGRIR